MRREHTLVVPIAAPREDVFAFYADRANVPLLAPICVWCTETGDASKPGVRTQTLTLQNGTTHSYEIDYFAYEAPSRVASSWTQHGIAFESDVRWVATPEGCEIHYELVGTPATLGGRLAMLLLWRGLERSTVQLFARLKQILESRATNVRRSTCSNCGAAMLVGHARAASCTYCGLRASS